MAILYFRYSAMNAGKTTQLVQVKYNYQERGQNVLVLKPSIDNRDGANKIRSRIGIECDAIVLNSDTNLVTLVRNYQEKDKIDCILIDEAQFLTKKQVLELCTVVDDLNIPCMAYGLRSDFKGNLFPGSDALLALSDSIEELKTICWCGKKALMNTRLLNGKAVFEGEQVQIGGNESYISLCRKHWREGKVNP